MYVTLCFHVLTLGLDLRITLWNFALALFGFFFTYFITLLTKTYLWFLWILELTRNGFNVPNCFSQIGAHVFEFLKKSWFASFSVKFNAVFDHLIRSRSVGNRKLEYSIVKKNSRQSCMHYVLFKVFEFVYRHLFWIKIWVFLEFSCLY